MELRQIEAFLAVAEELHFGRAAERLRMAQSPLSQTIKKLEKGLGTALFERNTRSVTLTAAGHSLLPHARKILDEVDLARRAVSAGTETVYGKLAIGFSGALNHTTLPPLTRALRQHYPQLEVTLHGGLLTQEALQLLSNNTLDLAFIGLPIDAPALATRRIATERLGVAVPADHPLAGRASVAMSELAADPFITMPAAQGSTLRDVTFAACAAAGFRPRISQEVADPYTALSLVAGGVGITLMPVSIKEIMPVGTAFLSLEGEDVLLFSGLAWNPQATSPAILAALQLAEEVLPTPK
ncbi:LysR substrate-binding domain-containing protein [Paenarthrobacter aurescens]|uniref:Transcriptional regulator n=1 Tax=Paenarthrobacter aurescens TaxID=43663 RepID=A0A4Y3N8G6_PAEAU|nr:LysR substrate-binding domain-containing protein [Paenarthrobacter aurescens]MDO6144806.1 LysR family transcriptional regulator [Paenarthrobacter aurescens]MDO6148651.1 LysR family transcriptional regulator [Paenarthrobacter aurescens]MDO6159897.1 LysR family transcriptional regulator [Paenarthrobacter aurescens]MDO6163756.1 LysR family transcriptional regulator [Paenarthrobacter aurescens]GEB17533.1 transcriptional regulator [Paenarthrobacter aurescens]